MPASLSIKEWGKKPRFYAWGHASDNNCSWADARRALELAYKCPDGVLFHNSKFDMAVAAEKFDLAPPPIAHDTLFLMYLDDPNQREMGLKPGAERLLDMPPDERDAVADWLVKHQPIHGTKITRGRDGEHSYNKYIPMAPGVSIVGPYANGDVIRTEAIFAKLWPSIVARGMLPCYEREQKLCRVLMTIERQGIRVDLDRLRADALAGRDALNRIDEYVRKRLRVSDLNLDSGGKLMEALASAGLIDRETAKRTEKTGQLASDGEALRAITDRPLSHLLQYRAQMKTGVGTFQEPWLDMAERSGGLIFTSWNQTFGAVKGGARTGRLSSSPNFQNIPNEPDPWWAGQEHLLPRPEAGKRQIRLPAPPIKNLPPLPLLRDYVVPLNKGDVLIDRDASQQEPRLLAHFERGPLMRQYQEDPWTDFHDHAKANLDRLLRRDFVRKKVKNINLGIIYGQGLGSLAVKNEWSVAETKDVRDAIYTLYPGLKRMYKEMKALAAAGKSFRTWGGREYYCEKPRINKYGGFQTLDYKMINTEIQGSAADCIKESMIRYSETKPADHFLLLSVHDQLPASVPAKDIRRGMKILQQAIESIEMRVPMLSEGKWSDTTWAQLRDYDKKGVMIYGVH